MRIYSLTSMSTLLGSAKSAIAIGRLKHLASSGRMCALGDECTLAALSICSAGTWTIWTTFISEFTRRCCTPPSPWPLFIGVAVLQLLGLLLKSSTRSKRSFGMGAFNPHSRAITFVTDRYIYSMLMVRNSTIHQAIP